MSAVAALADIEFEPVIGIEVHVELGTLTKMFCRCRNAPFELQPNEAVCPTCLGLPGALPKINKQAVLLGIRAALALNCKVADICIFERKNYPYPDLVKGYQVTQYQLPIGNGGSVKIFGNDGAESSVQLRRIHLEEDTAKLLHRDSDGDRVSWLDCNRAGVPLLEIVTEPTIHSGEEAEQYLRQLRTLLVHNGISPCRMQRGEMRLEANISIRPKGSKEFGPRVEVKNQSSFRFVRDAIAYEVARQTEVVRAGGTVNQTTCGWDPVLQRTFEQRSKEEAHDYRYFPEPDLPPVKIESDWVAEQDRLRPEPLDQFRARLIEQGVPEKDVKTILTRGAATYLYAANKAFPEGTTHLAKWMIRGVFTLSNEHNIEVEDSKLTAEEFAAAVKMKANNKVNDGGMQTILSDLFLEGGDAAEIAKAKSLFQISDAGAIGAAIDAAFAERPDMVTQFREGKTKVRNALFGMVMKKMAGRADPKQVEAEMDVKLKG